MADRIGQQLGHYRLVRLLGRGGFAEVYLGEHLRLKTQVAVKILHTSLEDDDVEGFLREAQTVAHLKHPHIVRVFDFEVENHTPYLVMDYLPNGNVRRSHPKGSVLPLATIVPYVKQVASALQYAHNQKLIHRDIKPENMLLDRDNTIVLSDFGIALLAQSSRYQSTQEVAGTAAYMAPEQFQGHPHRASDQYALGVVVYEWLTGDRPFHGSFTEIASQHLFVPPPPLHEKVPTISSEVEQVVLAALAKDPKQRFASVQVFATALEQSSVLVQPHPSAFPVVAFPQSQPLQSAVRVPPPQQFSSSAAMDAAIPPIQPLETADFVTPVSQSSQLTNAGSPLSREPGQSDRSRPLLLLSQHRISRRTIVVSLTGLIVAGGGLTWLALSQKLPLSSSSSRPTATSYPRSLPSPGPTRVPLGTTLLTYRGHSAQVNSVAWSPDSKRIASASYDGTVQIWSATTGDRIFTYHRHSDIVISVAWSPNSMRIASGSGDHTVQVWDAGNGGNAFTYTGHSSRIQSVAWSPNGTRIASGGGEDHTVQVWDAGNGGNAFTYTGHSGWLFAVTWSPNGVRIASGSGDKTVQVWDAANGGSVFSYHGHTDTVWTVTWSPDGGRIASGGDDTTVQVWDADIGSNLFTYRGHSARVWAGFH